MKYIVELTKKIVVEIEEEALVNEIAIEAILENEKDYPWDNEQAWLKAEPTAKLIGVE